MCSLCRACGTASTFVYFFHPSMGHAPETVTSGYLLRTPPHGVEERSNTNRWEICIHSNEVWPGQHGRCSVVLLYLLFSVPHR